MIQFVKQIGVNYLFNGTPGRFEVGEGNQPRTALERWQKAGNLVPFQRFSSNGTITSSSSNFRSSDATYSDASFVRLKNVSISWQIPAKVKHYLKLSNSRIFFQGQNLLLITKYKGLDPETRSNSVLPPLRTLSFGIELGF